MIELARSSVQPWECDTMGHMNVQFYVERCSDALSAFIAKIGLGPKALTHSKHRFELVDQHIRFLKELRPGTPYYLRGGAVHADIMALTTYCELVQTFNNEPAATFRTVSRLVQLADLETDGFEDGARAMAMHNKVEIPPYGLPRGLTLDAPRKAPTLADAEALKMVATYQGRVHARECDAHGFLEPRYFMARLSDSIPNLLFLTSGRNRGEPGSAGGAALEYRFIYRKYPRSGDLLCIRSGLRSIAEKTYVWAHWMFDVETGQCVGTAEAVAVAMDLATRKAIVIPPELRERLDELIVPGLTV
jgi:acyl-CoA thioester hydrolase